MKSIGIIIRPLRLIDINKNYISWFSDLKVTEYLEAKNITIKDSKKYLKNGILKQNYYIYAICDKKTAEHIGNIKIGPIRRFDGVSDLVTVIGNKNYWGKGVATEAIKIIVKKSFSESGIRKFCASIDSNNKGSLNAYQSAGFKVEAKLTNYFCRNAQGLKSYSDKIYVVYNNLDHDLLRFKKWEPISMLDIT